MTFHKVCGSCSKRYAVPIKNSASMWCDRCRTIRRAKNRGQTMGVEPAMSASQTDRYLELQLQLEVAAPWDKPSIEQEMRSIREAVSK